MFYGKFYEDKRHGIGIRRNFNGIIFRGKWNDNIPEGEGFISGLSVVLAKGIVKDGKIQTSKGLLDINGSRFEGAAANGTTGHGTITFHGGKFDGFFIDGEINGYGVYTK